MLRLAFAVGVWVALVTPACAGVSEPAPFVDFDAHRDMLADLWFTDDDGDDEDANRDASAQQASSIPNRPTGTVTIRTGTYDFGGRTIDGSGVGSGAPLFQCNKQSGITFRNVKIIGNPRYGLFIRSCNNMVIEDVTMDGVAVGGIRFDAGYPTTNLRIGNIRVEDIGGHGVELWDVDGYSIERVTSRWTGASGLQINRCSDGQVGTSDGDQNDLRGGYATMRFANGNGRVTVGRVKSVNSARGVFSVSNSRDATVTTVDIRGSSADGIYIQDSTNTRVNGGTSRGSPNCRIRGGSGNSIGADCGGSIAS